MPPPYPVGADLLASWTPSHENVARWLAVKVLEVYATAQSAPAPAITPPQTMYRVQTNMGITMVLPEDQLTDFPTRAGVMQPAESDFHG